MVLHCNVCNIEYAPHIQVCKHNCVTGWIWPCKLCNMLLVVYCDVELNAMFILTITSAVRKMIHIPRLVPDPFCHVAAD